jgi:anti-sigma B factor antagonist
MEVTSHIESNVTVVSIAGSIDGFTSDALLEALNEQIVAGARNLVIDLGEVDFISSAGLRAILQAQKQIRQAEGDLRISNSQERVLKVLRLSGYTSIFKIFNDTPAAVASFAS